MPVQALYDVVTDPPRALEDSFVLVARRITSTWLATRNVVASPDDVRLAAEFLARLGIRVEPLPDRLVRLASGSRSTVMSREAAVMTAIRCIVGSDAQRIVRSIARAA